MLRLQALQAALTGLVGFHPHYSPDLPQYSDELLESRSGLYINALQLIDAENLTAAFSQTRVTQYPEWQAKTYKRNAIVRVASTLYISNAPALATEAPADGGPWGETDILSARLRYIMDAAVAEVANNLANTNKLAGARTVVAETKLYHGAGNISSRIIKEGRFCGFELVVKDVRDLGLRLRSIGIQSDTANPDLPIYIYHTSTSVPIKILKPKFSGVGTFSWAAVADALLAFDGAAHAPGGAFLVGYYEDDVVGQMIERETAWPDYDLCYEAMLAAADCRNCNPANYDALRAWSQYSEVHPFAVASKYLNTTRELWDYSRHEYNYKANYGLNLDVSVECDVTQFLANNEMLLADALHKCATVKVLEVFTSTIEDNPIAEQCKLAAAYNLDNRPDHSPGLVKARDYALKGLSLEVMDGQSPCAPATPPGSAFEVFDGAA